MVEFKKEVVDGGLGYTDSRDDYCVLKSRST